MNGCDRDACIFKRTRHMQQSVARNPEHEALSWNAQVHTLALRLDGLHKAVSLKAR